MKKLLIALVLPLALFANKETIEPIEISTSIIPIERDEGYAFLETGIIAGYIPVPRLGVSYVGRYGNHAFEASLGVNTVIVMSIPYVSISYQYYLTPLEETSLYLGAGIQSVIYKDIYAGPNLQIGRMFDRGEKRWTVSCGAHKVRQSYLSSKRKWHLTPKIEFGYRL